MTTQDELNYLHLPPARRDELCRRHFPGDDVVDPRQRQQIEYQQTQGLIPSRTVLAEAYDHLAEMERVARTPVEQTGLRVARQRVVELEQQYDEWAGRA